MDASTPEIAHREFEERFNAGDLAGLLALYEQPAVFVRGPEDYVSTREALQASLEAFLATKGKITLQTRYAVQCGELALLSNEWHLLATGEDGKPVEMTGRTVEVVRRQAGGRWRYVIDHPWGAPG